MPNYFIDGYGSNRKSLAKQLNAVLIPVSWRKTISDIIIGKSFISTDIVIAFSLGAVIAYKIALKYPPKLLILCSMSPIHTFTKKEFYDGAKEHMSERQAREQTDDLFKIKIDLKKLRCQVITLAGDKEKDIKADLLVPNTGHILNANYIKAIKKLI